MRRDAAVCLGLVLATLVVYGQVVRHDFVNFDDDKYVYNNAHVQNGLSWKGVAWAFRTLHGGNWHPLTWLSHMIDCELFGLRAGCHHLTNLLLHVLATLLLYLALSRMTGAFWRSATVAGMFALHPLHVESVAWVSERKDVLSGLFFMLTIRAYASYGARPSLPRYGLVLGFVALGLMAKPMLVTLPFVLLLLDYWPLGRIRFTGLPGSVGTKGKSGRREDDPKRTALQLIVEKAPLFFLVAASSWVTLVAQKRAGAMSFTYTVPFADRIGNALVAYVAYLAKTVWPVRLAVFYPYRYGIPALEWAGAALLLTGITAMVFRAGRLRPYLPVGWLWYLGMLVPVIGLVQVGAQSMADRYTYLPLIGIFLMAVWGTADLVARRRVRSTVVAVVAGGVSACCMAAAFVQVGHWRSSWTLFKQAVTVTDGNALAHSGLGNVLMRRGKTEEAVLHYREAIRVDPRYALGHSNLALALISLGQPGEAVEHCEEALRINPRSAGAHLNLGVALDQLGRKEEAIAQYRHTLRIDPASVQAHNNLGLALLSQGRFGEAIAHFRAALRINPRLPGVEENLRIAQYREALSKDPGKAGAHHNLAVMLARQGRSEEAVHHFREALRLDPGQSEYHASLALALANQGNMKEAVELYREAIRLKPEDPGPYNNLAWIRATHPDPGLRDGAEAVRLADRACSLSASRSPVLLDTLAAAYAEAGKFPEAVSTLEEAIHLAASAGPQALVPQLEQRLDGYRGGRPYREPTKAMGDQPRPESILILDSNAGG